MSEAETAPGQGIPTDTPQQRGWDVAQINQALDRHPTVTADPAHGLGVSYHLGEIQTVDVELFPAAGVVRVTGADVQVALLRQEHGPRTGPEGVVFELPHKPDGRFLSVSPRGEVALFLVPDSSEAIADDTRTAFLGPQDAPSSAAGATTGPMIEESLPGDPVPAETHPPVSSPPVSDLPGSPERDYVPRLTGRLARNPRFHTNTKGVLVGEFDLGVKDSDDPAKTTWYAIAVFGERAAKLKDAIKQGDLVDVIGTYKHAREFTGRDGRKKRKEQYYATMVKLRG